MLDLVLACVIMVAGLGYGAWWAAQTSRRAVWMSAVVAVAAMLIVWRYLTVPW